MTAHAATSPRAMIEALDAPFPRQTDATRQRGREVVRVPFELDSQREELLRLGGAPGDGTGRNEPEGDNRGARPEPALARNPVPEREAPPVRRREQRERTNAEVLGVCVAVPVAHLELVPEIERDGRTVEPGAEVRSARRRADANRHDAASAIASGSASTTTGGALSRAAVSESLSPCPVRTHTTHAPGSIRASSSAARPAADEG